MKGVILAGGLGSRLWPLTKVTNKHLLPVFDQPMIFYPIRALARAGIGDVLVVVGERYVDDFRRLLGAGEEFGLRSLRFAVQAGSGGIADALLSAEEFAGGEAICVMLGDNLFEDDLAPLVRRYAARARGARIFLKEVPDAARYGVAIFEAGRLVGLEEKPAGPSSGFAVTGLYLYDARVFDFCRRIRPSARGELEITDVNRAYLESGALDYEVLAGWWVDAGEFEDLYRAASLVRASTVARSALSPAAADCGAG